MGVQGGFGVVVKIAVSSVLTAIVHVLDAEYSELEKVLAEMTGHDAEDGYEEYVATGKRKQSSFPLELGWDRDETTHQTVQAAFDSLEPVDMSIEDPLGIEVITFKAHIFKMQRVTKQDDGFRCKVEVQPTGAPTITYNESA